MAFESPAFANSGGSSTYSAEQTRRSVFFWAARTASNTPGIIAGGVGAAGDLAVSAPASGMSVNIAPGECLTGGGEGAHQGGYYGLNSATISVPISAANPSLPRIDAIVATISDSGYTEPTGGSGNQVTAQAIAGTPTSGASLVNLAGAPTLPLSSLLLAWVLVPAAATNIITADLLNVAAKAQMQFTTPASPVNYLAAAGSLTATSGQLVVAAPSTTITLPSPSTANQLLEVQANGSVAGSTPVTVSGTNIQGVGLSSASSFKLGTAGAYALLQSDGTNWWIIAGQQDTGWQALGLSSSVIAASGFETPSARQIADRVFLKGGMDNNSGGNISGGAQWASVPIAMRPTQQIGSGCGYYNSGVTTGVGFQLTTAGAISVGATLANGVVVTLDGVSYTLS